MKNYEDILYHPHPTSRKHPRMSMEKRAAQFAPFAALTGFEAEVQEAGRLTDHRMDLSEEEKAVLDRAIQSVIFRLEKGEHPRIRLVYFLPDLWKDGGSYETIEESVRKIDYHERLLWFSDGSFVHIEDIVKIEECK